MKLHKKAIRILYSDSLCAEMMKPLLQEMGRRLLVNASGKPYLSVKILKGEQASEIMTMVLDKMAQAKAEMAK